MTYDEKHAASVLNPSWRYVNANETNKPNYLRERFEAIRREQKAAERAEKSKPVPIAKSKRA